MTTTHKKNLGGRPRKVLTKKQIHEISSLAQYLTVEQIADHFGMTHVTFGQIRDRQPEVSIAYKKGKSKAIGFVASTLMNKIRDGDTTAAIFYLKTQAGWREKQLIDLDVNNSGLPAITLRLNDDAESS
jgi:hypothetical protein